MGAIAPKLEQAEIERAKRKPTESLDAYDYFLRGMAGVHRWTREANDEALPLFYRAIELDPNFASAYGLATWCYTHRKVNGWLTDHEKDIAEAARLAHRAAELGRDDALALCTAGIALAYTVGDIEDGAALIDRALVLNPNLAWAWTFGGWAKVYLGEPDAAIEREARAMRLSPQDSHMFLAQTATAAAHFFAGRYGEALSWSEEALRENPTYMSAWRFLAASCAMIGRHEQARSAMARLRKLDPALRISNLKHLITFRRPEDLANWVEGLRKAGLPE
jgi:tetratricopeptide (TPR) repeat protein